MIEVIRMTEKEKEDIKRLIDENGRVIDDTFIFDNDYYSLILKENHKIIGFGCFSRIENKAQLESLEIFLVDSEEKGAYIDFLFRALLNAADLEGLGTMHINRPELKENLIHKYPIEIQNEEYIVFIQDFFSKGCACK